MKIHLISPTASTSHRLLSLDGFTANTFMMPPLSITSLTAYLRENSFNVKQDDLNVNVMYDNMFRKKSKKIDINSLNVNMMRLKRHFSDKLDEDLEHTTNLLFKKTNIKKPDLIGISLSRGCSLICALLLAKKIKNELGTKIVFGGKQIAPPFAKEFVENFDFIDYFVLDSGELPLLRLCEALEKDKNFEKVPRLLYRENEKIKTGKSNEKFDSRNIPPPDFDGLPMYKYRKTCIDKKLILPYQAIRGCIYNCSFCSFRDEDNFGFKSPEKAVSEIQMLRDRYDTRFFFFLDNMININKKYLENFCNEIKKLDILWSDSMKVDSSLSKNNFIKMRNSGCIILTEGLESASIKILRYVKKPFTPQNAEKNFENLHKADIWSIVNLIIGFPHETEYDINSILKFIKKNRNFINSIRISEFALAHRSEMFRNPQEFKIKFGNYKQTMYLVPYDEIGGLKWEDKKSQNIISINKVLKFLRENEIDTGYPNAQNPTFNKRIDLVYNLYDQFYDKSEVIKNFRDICESN